MSAPETALSKPEVYESKQIQLTSPIMHIGSAVSKLNPFEYVQTDKKVYFPNQESLVKALDNQRENLQPSKAWQRPKTGQKQKTGSWFISQYIQAIEEQDDRKVMELLKQAFRTEWWKAKDPQGNLIFPENNISHKWVRDRISGIRPMLRNGFGDLYIPGSSIKGAIRTAIAYYLIQHQPARLSEIEQTLREKLKKPGQISRNKKSLGTDLFMNDLFSNFSLTYQNKQIEPMNSPNTDFMRAVKVTDSDPLLANKAVNLAVVAEVIISSFSRSNGSSQEENLSKYRDSTYVEMVHNVETKFILSLDRTVDAHTGKPRGMLSWFSRSDEMKIPFHTVEGILNICKEFAQYQWEHERNYWKRIKNNRITFNGRSINLDFDLIREFYAESECPYDLRLGWASGMLGTTVDLLLHDTADDPIRRGIRDECNPRNQAPGFEAPKSRRTVVNPKGNIEFAPGWVKFKVL